MPENELKVPSYKEVLKLIAQKAFEGLTKKADLPETYPKELTEETRKKVEEIMLSAQSGGILKAKVVPDLVASLLKNLPAPSGWTSKSSFWNLLPLERKRNTIEVLKEILSTPQKELSRVEQIKWKGGPFSSEKGAYFPGITMGGKGRIEYNPFSADVRTARHEFVHARHYVPEAEESAAAFGLREATDRAWAQILENLKKPEARMVSKERAWRDFYFNVSQTEAMARDMGRFPMRQFQKEYTRKISKYSKLAEEWLDVIVGEGASRKMWEEIIEGGR